jgi:hypothetical protein
VTEPEPDEEGDSGGDDRRDAANVHQEIRAGEEGVFWTMW